MKLKINYILLFLVVTFFNSFAQESPYNAMVFKSIINDENNIPIQSKELILNVELFSDNEIWYKETHTATTDQNGIVNLKIGTGTAIENSFNNIPWATSEIKIRIKYVPEAELSGSNFKTLETTALYAVPYAFHSLSASKLSSTTSPNSTSNSGNTGTSTSSLPSKSEFWSAYGNRNIDMRGGFLGTVDNSPLILKTNYLERLKISADGVTTFNSPLIVPRPFYATIDSLNVDKLNVNTISNLNANFIKLNVNSTDQSNTINDGALVVKGGVGIAKNLNVGENLTVNGNVNILGQMNFDGGVNFNAPIQTQSPITINDTSESYTEDNGALVVKGGVGIKKNVNIGGNIFGNKNLTITDNVIIKGSQNSTTKDDGNLLLENGGLGVEKNIFAGGNITTNSNMFVDKNLRVTLNSDLNTLKVNGTTEQVGVITVNNITISNNINEGALIVKGGVGIGDNLNVGKNLKVTENATIVGALSSNSLSVNNNFELLGTQESTTKDTGALIVQNGGLGVEKNIFNGGKIESNGDIITNSNFSSVSNTNVGNNLNVVNQSNLNLLNVNSTTNIKGITTVDNNTISNNINQGALIVKGGVGIGDNLNVGKSLKVTENATIVGALSSNSLSVNTNFELLGTQEATTKDTGALIVQNGGLGVEKNIFNGGKIESNGDIITNSNLSSLLNTTVGNNLNVVNQSNLNLLNVNLTTNIKGITTVDNNTISNNINQGALVVKGGVGIGDNLNVGKNLKVTENAIVSGALSSNSLSVNTNFELLGTQEATTKDTGALIIQNGGLGVEKNTFVGGKIESNGEIITNSNLTSIVDTNVGNNLSVVNKSNLNLLTVNSTTNIKGITTVENGTISNSPTQGALVVNGGVGIGDNLNVGKNLKVTGFTNLLDDTTLSKKITVNGISTFNDVLKIESTSDAIDNKALQVKGGALINGSTSMDGALKINSLLNPAPQDYAGNASLKTTGGAIIAGNLNVGGSLNVSGPINYRSGLTTKKQMIIDVFDYYDDPTTINLLNNLGYGRDLRYDSYALKINAVNQGIAIKVNRHDRSNYGAAYGDDDNAVVTTGNNFLSFWDNTGKMVGRVEGENLKELVEKNFTYVNKTDRKNVMIATRAIDVTILGLKDAIQALKVQQASAKYAAAAGLNSIITPSGNGSAPTSSSKLNEAASKLMEEQAKLVLETANLANKLVQFALDIALVEADLANSRNKVGVKYSSSSGDYAEYLELQNPKEASQIKWGNVVGVKGGKISLDTNNADKIMVVSMSPAVVGNMPEDKDLDKFKPVAFMGQIPVILINNAKIGDYILPSGNNDGLAIAKPADALQIDDYKQIIGVAWENSTAKSIINVAVGINSNDVVNYIKKQDNKLTDLENRINKLENLINNKGVAQNGTSTDTIPQSTIDYKTEFINVLDKSEQNQKIIADIKNILKTKNIDNLKNKQIYIDRVVQEYLGINQSQVNKLDPTQQTILNAYVDAIKFKVSQS